MKRNVFRVGILVLTLLLACMMNVAAAGEGENQDAEKDGPIEISFWSLFTGGDGEYFDAMVEEFNRTHDDIVMTTDTVKFDNYYTKVTTALTANTAPDVIVVHRSRLLDYVPKNVLYPLDDLMAKVDAPMDDFVQATIDGCTFDGVLYALPLDVHALIMYYNTALFEQAGITEVPVSFDEVIEAAQKIQAGSDAVGITADNTTATYKAYTLTRLFMSFIEQQGVSLLTEDLSAANFNNVAGEKALQGLIDMVNKYGITPAGLDYDSSVTSFKLGKAGMHFNGVWATGGFEAQEGLEFAAVPLPAMFGEPAAWSGSHTMAVPIQKNMDDARLEAIAEFMLWMSARGDLWAKAGHIPVRKSVSANEDFLNLPYRSGYAAAAQSSFAVPRTAAWGEIYSNMSDALEFAVATNQDAGEALADMEQMVNNIIASY